MDASLSIDDSGGKEEGEDRAEYESLFYLLRFSDNAEGQLLLLLNGDDCYENPDFRSRDMMLRTNVSSVSKEQVVPAIRQLRQDILSGTSDSAHPACFRSCSSVCVVALCSAGIREDPHGMGVAILDLVATLHSSGAMKWKDVTFIFSDYSALLCEKLFLHDRERLAAFKPPVKIEVQDDKKPQSTEVTLANGTDGQERFLPPLQMLCNFVDIPLGQPFDVIVDEDPEPIRLCEVAGGVPHHVLATVKENGEPAIVAFHPSPNTHVMITRFHLHKFDAKDMLQNRDVPIDHARVSEILLSMGQDDLASTFDINAPADLQSQVEGLSQAVAMSLSV